MFARTERLLLRPGWAEDAPALAQAIGDAAIVRNLARAPWPYGEDDARSFLNLDPGGLPSFLMFARTGGAPRLIGGCGIGASPEGGLEIGYWVARPYWGLGFATEAGRQVMAIARTMRLPRLTGAHFADNPASGSVLRKLGFRPTGRVVQRRSLGRGGDVACVLFEEGGGSGEGSVIPMRRNAGAGAPLAQPSPMAA